MYEIFTNEPNSFKKHESEIRETLLNIKVKDHVIKKYVAIRYIDNIEICAKAEIIHLPLCKYTGTCCYNSNITDILYITETAYELFHIPSNELISIEAELQSSNLVLMAIFSNLPK